MSTGIAQHSESDLATMDMAGAVALGHVVSAIAGVALKHLTQDVSQSSEVVWSGDDELLSSWGGAWTSTPGKANSLVHQHWGRRSDCPTCA